jgi:hypothetical protein
MFFAATRLDVKGQFIPVQQSLEAWQTANSPSTPGGEWQFNVSLYSAIEPAMDRPILRLERIVSMLAGGL